MKVVITGAAGLIGQNLTPRLKQADRKLICIDKNAHNLAILRSLHPDVEAIEADMAKAGAWTDAIAGADAIVCGQAQIGGLDPKEFEDNNVTATKRLLDACSAAPNVRFVHLSSSVVNSAAVDLYTESKKAQEALVAAAGLNHIVLRPTLMFGWFDRKHVGWLARFMKRAPVFPIPGDGKYLRQPLYAGDFCAIIAACVERPNLSGSYNISGQEKVDYIDLIRSVREANELRTPIVKIPYGLFWSLLATYALFNANPPFTTAQLKALATPDVFEVIDWPGIFGVKATPLREALVQTFRDPVYSSVVLEF